jgi:hypothetical protein
MPSPMIYIKYSVYLTSCNLCGFDVTVSPRLSAAQT